MKSIREIIIDVEIAIPECAICSGSQTSAEPHSITPKIAAQLIDLIEQNDRIDVPARFINCTIVPARFIV
jgi:hypothetical protein